jgi:hypothetical protein
MLRWWHAQMLKLGRFPSYIMLTFADQFLFGIVPQVDAGADRSAAVVKLQCFFPSSVRNAVRFDRRIDRIKAGGG